MTGPEHYAEAERLLQNTEDEIRDRIAQGIIPDQYMVQTGLAAAQVHATLALAAATAMGDRTDPELEWPANEKLNERWGKVLA